MYEMKEFFLNFAMHWFNFTFIKTNRHIQNHTTSIRSENLKTGESLAHILLQLFQTSRHILLKEQLLEPCPPGHQVREVLLLVALNVEKFGEKLLPNLNIPPPLEAPFSLPSVSPM